MEKNSTYTDVQPCNRATRDKFKKAFSRTLFHPSFACYIPSEFL